MIYPIVIYGNAVLKKQAEPITKDYPNLPTLIEDMYKTLDRAEGVGLAAPQIGLPIKLFIVDLSLLKDENPEWANLKRYLSTQKSLSLAKTRKLKKKVA